MQFNHLIAVYRAINFGADPRRGALTIADEQQRDLLVALLADGGDEFGLRIQSGDIDALQIGDTIELEVNDPRIGLGIVATDLDDLLSSPKAYIHEPARYFVLGEGFAYADTNIPEGVRRYRQVLALVDLLRQAAAYLDEETAELIFIDAGKFELLVRYDSGDLQKIDPLSIQRLLESFGEDTHRKQKLAILGKSVQSVCGTAKPKERFSVLLEQLPELLKSFSEGYRLFVADFSYDKIVDQLEVAKLEEIGKIHKTFSDVQNQILGIPVATVIVATQMKMATAMGYEFWVNTAVLIGVWVFAVLSFFVLRNQLHTLTAIGQEIERKKQQMLQDYKSVSDLITKSFPFLEKRLRAQKIAFYSVNVVLCVGLVLAHVVYFVLTHPSRDWLTGVVAGIVHL